MPAKAQCIVPDCDRPSDGRRGCCRPCYEAARRAITAGTVTDAQLVASGLLAAPIPTTERCGRERLNPMRRQIDALLTTGE